MWDSLVGLRMLYGTLEICLTPRHRTSRIPASDRKQCLHKRLKVTPNKKRSSAVEQRPIPARKLRSLDSKTRRDHRWCHWGSRFFSANPPSQGKPKLWWIFQLSFEDAAARGLVTCRFVFRAVIGVLRKSQGVKQKLLGCGGPIQGSGTLDSQLNHCPLHVGVNELLTSK